MTSELFGQGWGNYSIRGITEISLPESVSMLPQTLGWKILALLAIIWLSRLLIKMLRKYWRNRYRKAALKKLAEIQKHYETGDKQALRQLPALIKATSLHAYPRAQVASLSGKRWHSFLQQSYANSGVNKIDTSILSLCAYSPLQQLNDAINQEHWLQYALWIKHHRNSYD